MKTYRTFNSVEFNSYVNFIKETVKHVFSNTKSKNVICQAAKDYNYNVEDVYQYLHEITKETYPEYMMKLNNRNWRKIYDSYMFDEELAPRLQEILDCTEGKEDDNFYRDSFFQVIKDMGVNPEIMKIDMALDTFGWLWTLLLIVKKAEENPFTGEFAVKIKIKKRIPKTETIDKEISHGEQHLTSSSIIGEEKLEKSEEKVSKMFIAYYLNRNKELDKTREIGRFSSQQDVCNSLGINKGVLSNYLKGRKDSIFWNNEDGQKVRIGVEKLAA